MDCGDNQTCQIMTTIVCPLIGTILAIVLFLAPMRQMREIWRSGQWTPALNPLPFPLIVANCTAWILYGLLKKDPWIVTPNILGQALGLFYFVVTVPHLNQRQTRTFTVILLAGLLIPNIGAAVAFIGVDGPTGKSVMGWTCVIILVAFYSSPLTSMAQVIKTKDSSTIAVPLAVAALLNSAFWVIYGLFIADAFVWAPNAIGAVTAIVQLSLCIIYRRKTARSWFTVTARNSLPLPDQESNVSDISETSVEPVLIDNSPK